MKIFYKTRATAAGGRSCHTALDNGSLALDLAMPGSGKTGANPEQLFALGYAACAWAAVRQGATLARQGNLPASRVREGMYREILRRAAAVAAGRYGRCGFTPPSAQPPTAMAQGLACQWFNLGPAYWTALPSTEALQPRFVTSG